MNAYLGPIAHVRALLDVITNMLSEYEQESMGYGYCPPGLDPRRFTPDEECVTPEEIEKHRADRERAERGEQPTTQLGRSTFPIEIAGSPQSPLPPGADVATVSGGVVSVQWGGYGIGVYSVADARMEAIHGRLRDILRELQAIEKEAEEEQRRQDAEWPQARDEVPR